MFLFIPFIAKLFKFYGKNKNLFLMLLLTAHVLLLTTHRSHARFPFVALMLSSAEHEFIGGTNYM